MKYKFEGIGETGALAAMGALSSTPLAFLTVGILGKFTFLVLKIFFMAVADKGLIVMNIGVADVTTLMEKHGYDGSWDKAEKIIQNIKRERSELSDEEKKRIDEPVKAAFRKFARLARMRNGGASGNKPKDSSTGKR